MKLPCTGCNRSFSIGTLLKLGVDNKPYISDSGGLCSNCMSLFLNKPRCENCKEGIGEILSPVPGEDKQLCYNCRRTWWNSVISGFTSRDFDEALGLLYEVFPDRANLQVCLVELAALGKIDLGDILS